MTTGEIEQPRPNSSPRGGVWGGGGSCEAGLRSKPCRRRWRGHRPERCAASAETYLSTSLRLVLSLSGEGGMSDGSYRPIADVRATAYPSWMRSSIYLLLPLLAACDAWPTVVDNRTQSQLAVRYLHRDFDHWSAPFPISAGKAMPLARAHWIQDILALRIEDGSRSYSVSGDALQRIKDACPSTEIGRRFSTAGTCYLIYLGGGRLQTMAATPRGLEWEQAGNGS